MKKIKIKNYKTLVIRFLFPETVSDPKLAGEISSSNVGGEETQDNVGQMTKVVFLVTGSNLTVAASCGPVGAWNANLARRSIDVLVRLIDIA